MIYWKRHWMDSITPGKLVKRTKEKPDFKRKYYARYKSGDFAGVFEDNRVSDTQHGGDFVIVRVPNVSLKTGLEYLTPLFVPDGVDENNEPKIKMIKRSKFALDEKFIEPLIKSIGRVVKLSKDDFLNNIIEKIE